MRKLQEVLGLCSALILVIQDMNSEKSCRMLAILRCEGSIWTHLLCVVNDFREVVRKD